MHISDQYVSELFSIKEKMNNCLKSFQKGELILVGDDGLRENEVDLVFHANGATPENVNFAITHAKGLLCVSLSHDLANKLGFSTAPQLPGGMAHTNFTISVDAKHNITNGISAKDRAHTIGLMAQPQATHDDFISPGHIFPLRAMNGGLLARAGHTEALYEICRMSHLPYAAAMCEILGENGEALNPQQLSKNLDKKCVFHNIPYISTVDILWNRILFEKSHETQFYEDKQFLSSTKREEPISVYILKPGLEKNITLPTVISIYDKNITPESIRITITNSCSKWENSVSLKECSAEISLFSLGNCIEKIPKFVKDFCDMSAKEGLNGTKTSVKRAISILRSLQFIQEINNHNISLQYIVQKVKFLSDDDKEFFMAVSKISS
ncbi:3,4-dihydroxy-2-butanone-4-phosphate synthase [Silvanigrella aquatica]|uniref:3,4-dihydroxy-2-butanone 4-phosphate synthase n=1 Tax=Silvanigrella aquatica TaxID=1915309 RepID=A0A1L4D241_9BACT|nr:3,4-dihydroxy-2-butanone-4-phosphate synthase [Silvanigrella aquatica]APJ04273.1 hypothetical protein AXG55_10290 [Silvanigrella aquatica]